MVVGWLMRNFTHLLRSAAHFTYLKKVINAIDVGDIKQLYLVGGCVHSSRLRDARPSPVLRAHHLLLLLINIKRPLKPDTPSKIAAATAPRRTAPTSVTSPWACPAIPSSSRSAAVRGLGGLRALIG